MRGANIVRGELPAPEGKCVTALPASSLSSGVVQAPGDGPEDPDKAVLEKVPSVINQSSSSDPSLLASRTSAATPDLDPLPMLRPTATSPLCTPPAVELQEVLVQPSRTIDTGEHHKAYLDSFRPAAVEVQPLQLDQPAQVESELSTPKPNESREVTPGVDLPARSNQNGSLVEEAIAAAPPVRKRQAWRRSSTLVEDSTHKMTRPPRPSAQNRLQALSWRAPGESAPASEPLSRRHPRRHYQIEPHHRLPFAAGAHPFSTALRSLACCCRSSPPQICLALADA